MRTANARRRPNSSAQLEGALQAPSERLDNLPAGNDSAATFAHLEQRVSYLLERLEAASESRGANGGMNRIEEGLQDILRHLERQQDSFAATPPSRRCRRPAMPVRSRRSSATSPICA
ncbi:MAG: hypothetical protein MZV49_16605 [Rhodopseudomonas palustris]|nr:hypothetical protein [Rhodopseudomonas palustris]